MWAGGYFLHFIMFYSSKYQTIASYIASYKILFDAKSP